MLWTIPVVLLVLRALGLVTSYAMGGEEIAGKVQGKLGQVKTVLGK